MEEIWKPLEGYDHSYFASNTGKIKKDDYELKAVRFAKNDGNLVLVKKNNKRAKILVSRLIAECFLGLDRNDLTKRVIRIDGDLNNDSVDNLKIVDRTHTTKNFLKSGVNNVTWYEPNKKWKIAFALRNPRRMIHVGYFIDMQDAINVYRNWESARAGKIPDTKYPGLVHIKAESKWRVDVFDKHANIYHIDYYNTEKKALEDWKMYNWILDQS
jgi:hypothetical protein